MQLNVAVVTSSRPVGCVVSNSSPPWSSRVKAAPARAAFTLLLQGGLLFETTHPTGLLLVTTATFSCMPLIRYALGPAGPDLRHDGS